MCSVGNRIRETRKKLGYTLKQLGQLTGMSIGNLSDIERGVYLPSSTSMFKIAKALNCSQDWLLMGNTEISSNSGNSNFTEISNEGDYIDLTNTLTVQENKLLKLFRQLPAESKKELVELIEYKVFKNEQSNDFSNPPQNVKSSNL